ncbi:MAG: helix-turn-helix domain-containing protein [Anaerolineae bacterium]
MITIFNGRSRGLGKRPASQVYAKIDITFREHLHLFKGAKLAVLLAISLHADEDGWAWPSYRTLSRETGYSQDKIRDALSELCRMTIDGHRVLLRYQPQQTGGQFASNRYLLFPTPEEVEQYEHSGISHQPGIGFAGRAVVAKHHNKPEPC